MMEFPIGMNNFGSLDYLKWKVLFFFNIRDSSFYESPMNIMAVISSLKVKLMFPSKPIDSSDSSIELIVLDLHPSSPF